MSKSQSGSALLIILVIVVITLVGGGAYYLGTKNTQPVTESQSTALKMSGVETNTDSLPPIETQTNPIAVNDPYSEIPAGWTREQSEGCSASIPLPPKKDPYYIDPSKSANYGIDAGGWWQLIEQAYSNPQDKFFTTEELITFENPENDNDDYVAGLVQVICGPNDKNYTTETFSDAYSKQFTDGTFGGLTFMKIGQMPMWGRSVTLALIQGGMYTDDTEYYFATPKQVFRIRAISNSTNKVINDTTQLILKNLQF